MPLPFSPYLEKNGFIFTSGQVHITPVGKLLEGTIEEKTTQVMKNLEEVLEKAGVGFKDVVKSTVYITDISNYGKVSETYATFFTENFPAREIVCVKALPDEITPDEITLSIPNRNVRFSAT
ncbi:MAG: Endoribonuclease L-PSP [Microgenomates group bacterium GW2011_GWC2_46_7]|nr:MAG: Endoribonuclease L-PSP [Microgenomates group bacterium GW2011_GWC2_46_7]